MTESIPHIPILLIWFNRPQHASRVLERLRACRPTQLYIAIDGPRLNHFTDAQNVAQCLQLIDTIDWPCMVKCLVREKNLGCKYGVSSAIDWFFEQVECGIILEDDCLPDTTFFSFCTELLQRYSNDYSIMHISGSNLVQQNRWSSDSYIFTTICHIWGWATWRRAWKLYDVTMTTFLQEDKKGKPYDVVHNESSARFWQKGFQQTYSGQIDTWDYQWVYAIWLNKGLCILPDRNLVQNIGFDAQATHTVKDSSPYANLPTSPITKIIHPKAVAECVDASYWLHKTLYQLPSWPERFKGKLRNRLRLS